MPLMQRRNPVTEDTAYAFIRLAAEAGYSASYDSDLAVAWITLPDTRLAGFSDSLGTDDVWEIGTYRDLDAVLNGEHDTWATRPNTQPAEQVWTEFLTTLT